MNIWHYLMLAMLISIFLRQKGDDIAVLQKTHCCYGENGRETLLQLPKC